MESKIQDYEWLKKQPGYLGHFLMVSIADLVVLCDNSMKEGTKMQIRDKFPSVKFKINVERKNEGN